MCGAFLVFGLDLKLVLGMLNHASTLDKQYEPTSLYTCLITKLELGPATGRLCVSTFVPDSHDALYPRLGSRVLRALLVVEL